MILGYISPAGKPKYYIPYRVVAASDATDESKKKAHYVCDGTNDQEEIQQAINDLNDVGGGILYLTEGTFNISGAITLYSNIRIIGSGEYTTKLNKTNAGYFFGVPSDTDNIIFENFEFTFASGTQFIYIGNYYYLKNAIFRNIRATSGNPMFFIYAYKGSLEDVTIENCYFYFDRYSIVLGEFGIYRNFIMRNCIVKRKQYCERDVIEFYHTGGEVRNIRITNNWFYLKGYYGDRWVLRAYYSSPSDLPIIFANNFVYTESGGVRIRARNAFVYGNIFLSKNDVTLVYLEPYYTDNFFVHGNVFYNLSGNPTAIRGPYIGVNKFFNITKHFANQKIIGPIL